MSTKSRLIIILFVSLLSELNVYSQNLQSAFDKISNIKGFQTIEYSAEEYGYPKEIVTMKMVGYGNSEPREEFLLFYQLFLLN